MDAILKTSYRLCQNVARQRARNFYYAFTVLPKPKRRAICAVYAFMRYCDDISDSHNSKKNKIELLQDWRQALTNTMSGDYSRSDILPGFHDAVQRFNIPESYFHELINGAEMDLSINRYQTFDDLYQYCYKVASIVGLVCIQIFGFSDETAKKHAEYCGVAFQLTNILRDIKEDIKRDRIYIPAEDMSRFEYSEHDLLNGVVDDRFRSLVQFEIERARDYYEMGMPLVNMVDTTSRAGLTAMIGIYSSILDRIHAADYDVFKKRISLTTKEKLSIAAHSLSWSRPGGRENAYTNEQM